MLDPQQSVASLVLDHSECTIVLKRHRIDFCCRGDLSIEAACAARGLDTDVVLHELAEAIVERSDRDPVDPRTLSTHALVGHIVATHHAYLRQALPFVQSLSAKIARVHGEVRPKLRELGEAVDQLSDIVLRHVDDEERSLFPLLLEKHVDGAHARRELATMLEEHLAVAALLERIRIAADDFEAPEWACNSHRALLSELACLENDTLRHVHLENHVLMPRFTGA